jgi:hypothetical protein
MGRMGEGEPECEPMIMLSEVCNFAFFLSKFKSAIKNISLQNYFFSLFFPNFIYQQEAILICILFA